MAPFSNYELLALALAILMILVTFFYYRPRDDEKVTDRVRCPSCGKFRAGERVGDQLIGIFQKRAEFINLARDSKSQITWHEKYKILYKCKYCGHEWIGYKSITQ